MSYRVDGRYAEMANCISKNKEINQDVKVFRKQDNKIPLLCFVFFILIQRPGAAVIASFLRHEYMLNKRMICPTALLN